MKILKFGGTSVGSYEGICGILGILKDSHHAGKVSVVVVSAMSGVTDTLIDIAQKAAAGNREYSGIFTQLLSRHKQLASSLLKSDERKSAVKEITNGFLELARILEGISLLGELSARTLDLVMSFGERISTNFLCRVLNANGINAAYLDTRTVIKTNDRYGNAQYLPQETYANIRAYFTKKNIPLQVATGFIASTIDGQTVTLGRGGSDLTATIFGAAL